MPETIAHKKRGPKSRLPVMRTDAERNALALENRNLIYPVLQRLGVWQGHRNYDDLEAEAFAGLLHACSRWDASQCVLSTYSHKWIWQYAVRALKKRQLIHLPEHLTGPERLKLLQKLTPWSVHYPLVKKNGDIMPEEFALWHPICLARSPLEEAIRHEDIERVRGAIDRLSPRLAIVVSMRMDGKKLDDVAAFLKVTKERVRQLQVRAMKQMRQMLVRRALAS